MRHIIIYCARHKERLIDCDLREIHADIRINRAAKVFIIRGWTPSLSVWRAHGMLKIESFGRAPPTLCAATTEK